MMKFIRRKNQGNLEVRVFMNGILNLTSMLPHLGGSTQSMSVKSGNPGTSIYSS